MTNPLKNTSKLQTRPSLAKRTSVPKVEEKVGDVNDTPSKRKETSPFQPESRKKRKIKNRKKKPEQKAPCDMRMETDPPKTDQESTDPAWQNVETTKKKKKMKENKKKKEDGRLRLLTRQTRPCAIIAKPTDGKSCADILNEVKKEPTLEDVCLAVARVRKTLAGDVSSHT